jgi:hypothetical protein
MHADARPPAIENAAMLVPLGAALPGPRFRCQVGPSVVEVWCVQDLMDPSLSGSLTWEKARVLPYISKRSPQADLIVAFGTAANPASADRNGDVVIGTRVFVHDPYSTPPDPRHHWTHPELNRIIDGGGTLPEIPGKTAIEVGKRMLRCPNASATPPTMSADEKNVAVGVINVTNSSEYSTTDARALAAFKAAGGGIAASLETTHGVIRLVLDRPFLYVSGLANGVGRFEQENKPNAYSQNFAAAHNAAVALAWLLPHVMSVAA